jgi:hypothetical protein
MGILNSWRPAAWREARHCGNALSVSIFLPMPLWLRGKKDFHCYRWPMPAPRSAFHSKWCVKQVCKASYFEKISASFFVVSGLPT